VELLIDRCLPFLFFCPIFRFFMSWYYAAHLHTNASKTVSLLNVKSVTTHSLSLQPTTRPHPLVLFLSFFLSFPHCHR
jgi:hypothetical protein